MDFVVDTSSVIDAVSKVFNITPPKKSALGDPSGVRVDASEDGFVYFSVSGSNVFGESVIEAEVRSPGHTILDLSKLFKSLTGFSPFKNDKGVKEIRFRSSSQKMLLSAVCFYGIKKVKQQRSISLLDAPVNKVEIKKAEEFIQIPVDVMSKGVRSVLFSVSTSKDMGGFGGVFFALEKNKLILASMNGVCLTEFRHFITDAGLDVSCVVDSEHVPKISKMLYNVDNFSEADEVDILITDKVFVLRADGFTMGTSVLKDKFPEYKGILADKQKIFVVDAAMFKDNVQNITYSTDIEDDSRVSLKFFDGELSISTESCENEGIPLEFSSGNSVQADFNASLLEGVVKLFAHEKIRLNYDNRHSPFIFTASGDKDEKDYSLISILAPLK